MIHLASEVILFNDLKILKDSFSPNCHFDSLTKRMTAFDRNIYFEARLLELVLINCSILFFLSYKSKIYSMQKFWKIIKYNKNHLKSKHPEITIAITLQM